MKRFTRPSPVPSALERAERGDQVTATAVMSRERALPQSAKGTATATSLREQVEVMRRIAVLLNGRVHGFAPFCPFREAMTSRGTQDGESMRLVEAGGRRRRLPGREACIRRWALAPGAMRR